MPGGSGDPLSRAGRSALRATLLYALVAVAVTWPLVARAGRDLPGDLIDPLFTCWALGWNFHMMGLSDGGPAVASWWDANIFHPTKAALARSEHFIVQSALGAPVFALTRDLVLTYNVLFLATFVLSGTFMYLLARDETGDEGAALGAGLLYGFALVRWTQLAHLGGLSSQWMPLALLAARRVARGGPSRRSTAAWMAALAVLAAVQVAASGYYLLFFPPFLLLWSIVEAVRAGRRAAWARLAASGAAAALLALPLVLPYVALRAGGAERNLAAVMEHSADLLSWLTAPEVTRLWGPVLDAFPRGEARLFPGVVTPLLALAGLAGGAALAFRAAPARRGLLAFLKRRELLLVVLALIAAWLSLGPLVTRRGWPTGLPALYRPLYENVPGFDSGRSVARFAMLGALFASLAAAWGLRHLRTLRAGRHLAWLACLAFVFETAAAPLPLSRQWRMPDVASLPAWNDGRPSPIVAAVRALPDDAVLAAVPFREMFHEARFMFDSAFHWRRMINGYSSWAPPEYTELTWQARDPLRRPLEALAALRAAGVTHVLVHEPAWRGPKGERVTERLTAAGARFVAREGDMALLALR